MFPVSGINYTGSITEEFNGDLRLDGSGTCGAGWLALLDMLQKQRAASSTADVVLGLLPDTFPPVPTDPNPTTGCGGFGGVAAAFASSFADSTFRHFTVAHELGHAYGRPHAPCPADPTPNYLDTTYPTYLGCPSGIACPSGSPKLLATSCRTVGAPGFRPTHTYNSLLPSLTGIGRGPPLEQLPPLHRRQPWNESIFT
jgi:hypothetical protein